MVPVLLSPDDCSRGNFEKLIIQKYSFVNKLKQMMCLNVLIV